MHQSTFGRPAGEAYAPPHHLAAVGPTSKGTEGRGGAYSPPTCKGAEKRDGKREGKGKGRRGN